MRQFETRSAKLVSRNHANSVLESYGQPPCKRVKRADVRLFHLIFLVPRRSFCPSFLQHAISVRSLSLFTMPVFEPSVDTTSNQEQLTGILVPVLVMLGGIGISYGIYTTLRWFALSRRLKSFDSTESDAEAMVCMDNL